MTKKLMRMSDIASALGLGMTYVYMLSANDQLFPRVVERIGNANLYRPADVARYVRSRKSKRRQSNRMDFG
jgi:predicted DNA-binding transcriptional regulator AlpA